MQKYGIPLSRYTVFLQNCPLEWRPNGCSFFVVHPPGFCRNSTSGALSAIMPFANAHSLRTLFPLTISIKEVLAGKSARVFTGYKTKAPTRGLRLLFGAPAGARTRNNAVGGRRFIQLDYGCVFRQSVLALPSLILIRLTISWLLAVFRLDYAVSING